MEEVYGDVQAPYPQLKKTDEQGELFELRSYENLELDFYIFVIDDEIKSSNFRSSIVSWRIPVVDGLSFSTREENH